jgi:DNA segregation ATPase FtsK/SpoIIIE-like protein
MTGGQMDMKDEKLLDLYCFPPSSLLTASRISGRYTEEEIKNNAERLGSVLGNFGVSATVVNVTQGASVTRYEIEANPSVKLTSLTNLADDIAMSLGAVNVRIAPVPDKVGVIGIGIPNRISSTVYMRDLIESPEFVSASDPATVIIGRGVDGQNIVARLGELSHILIAGSDYSGKTVFMDSIITSMLYKASPEQLRFLLIDAKMVDLVFFNGIPHLLSPVVTDENRVIEALGWIETEIDRRNNLIWQRGKRNIDAYNESISKDEFMPRIVVVIDHVAVLLGIHKELEVAIGRISQNSLKCGVHLIISTQSPEIEVVNSIIKSINPSRIVFRLNWNEGSRIMLGTDEAKKLLGRGDMLYLPNGAEKPLRVQGCYISEDEIKRVVGHIEHTSSPPIYSKEMLAHLYNRSGSSSNISMLASKNYDEMDGHEFEAFCADLLQKNGYTKVRNTTGSGDYGVDIFAEKDGITYAIQCKRFSSNIGNKAVQEIFSGKNFYKCDKGAVLTNQYFTSAAKKTAEHTGVILWDRDFLVNLIVTSKRAYCTSISNINNHSLDGNWDSTLSAAEDPLLPAAIEAIIESGQGSTSYLQRRLKLGYARCVRLMDEMEERGIVGPFEGSKPRAVLITQEEWEKMGQAVDRHD